MKLIKYLLFLFPLHLFAEGYMFNSYTLEDGVPQSQVFIIYQDSKGYLWFGTNGGGICRYNGKDFTTFNSKKYLKNSHVWSINEDRSGNIWFGCEEGGITKFNGSAFKDYTDSLAFGSHTIFTIINDCDGNILFGTNGAGLFSYNGKSVKNYTMSHGLSSNNVNMLYLSHNCHVWIGTNSSLQEFDGENFLNLPEKISKNISGIYTIYEDMGKNVWVGSEYGLYKYKNNNLQHYTMLDGLTGNSINAIKQDQKENIWVATNNGLNKIHFKPDGKAVISTITQEDGLCYNQINWITIDKEQSIWFGTNGRGICKYKSVPFEHFDKKNGIEENTVWGFLEDSKGNFWASSQDGGVRIIKNEKFTAPNEDLNKLISKTMRIYETANGNILFGGEYDGIVRYDGKKVEKIQLNGKKGSNLFVLNFFEDSKNNLWVGTMDDGLLCFTDKPDDVAPVGFAKKSDNILQFTVENGLSSNNVNQVWEDKAGNIWLATDGGGLSIFDFKRFYSITTKNGLPNNFISGFLRAANGFLYFGTFGNGVFCITSDEENRIIDLINEFDKSNKKNIELPVDILNYSDEPLLKMNKLGMDEGLADDQILSLIFDNELKLWLGTNRGINKIELNRDHLNGLNAKKITHYGKEEGFTGIECNHGAIYKDSQGNIWFGSITGAFKYIPENDNPNKVLANTVISSVRLLLTDSIISPFATLPHYMNYISFDFIGISYTNSKSVKYQFMLEGLDESWLPVTFESSSIYSNLKPGEYTFKVKSCNSSGLWNVTPAIFSFEITQPYWKTWWFIALVVGFASVLVYLSIKTRLRVMKNERSKLRREVNIRTNEIKEKNIAILDSIQYAKKLQEAVLPSKEEFKKIFPDSFIISQPKEIVSGDFFWYSQVDLYGKQFSIVAVADCTGHGVPGALISMIGNELLNQIVNIKKIVRPAAILNQLDLGLKASINKDNNITETMDGMDIVVCTFNLVDMELQFASAHRPLFIISKSSNTITISKKELKFMDHFTENGHVLTSLKPDKITVGRMHFNESRIFNNHQFSICKGDCIYLFTDGIVDQIGGDKRKRFRTSTFRQFLAKIQSQNLHDQSKILMGEFMDWKGLNNQTDDIMVVGIRI